MTENIEGNDIYQEAETIGNRAYGHAVAGRFADAVAIWGSMPKATPNKADSRLDEIRDRYVRGIVEELVMKMTTEGDASRDKLVELISREERSSDDSLTDQESGLRVPPVSRIPYNGRSAKYEKQISVEEFIQKEWGDYAKHHLLYSEHIREFDYSLYKAIYYRAKQKNLSTDEYMFSLGILTRHYLMGFPPPNLQRQVALLKRVRVMTRAQTAEKRVHELND